MPRLVLEEHIREQARPSRVNKLRRTGVLWRTKESIMVFCFDNVQFEYIDLPDWSAAEAYAREHRVELLGEHICVVEADLAGLEHETEN